MSFYDICQKYCFFPKIILTYYINTIFYIIQKENAMKKPASVTDIGSVRSVLLYANYEKIRQPCLFPKALLCASIRNLQDRYLLLPGIFRFLILQGFLGLCGADSCLSNNTSVANLPPSEYYRQIRQFLPAGRFFVHRRNGH